MKFSVKDFFSKYDQIHRKLRIWSHLLKQSLVENFIFCAVLIVFYIGSYDHSYNLLNLYMQVLSKSAARQKTQKNQQQQQKKPSKSVKLSGIMTNDSLSFNEHLDSMIKRLLIVNFSSRAIHLKKRTKRCLTFYFVVKNKREYK